MNKIVITMLLMALIYGLQALAEESVSLMKLPLDDQAIGTTINQDKEVKIEGAASLRIGAKWPTVINLGEIAGDGLDGTALTLRAKLKSKNLNGSAYLEMWSLFPGGGEYFSRGFITAVTLDTDWKESETPFVFKGGQNPDRVILNLVIKGAGTVWIDDVRLDKQPLAK